MSWSLIRVQQQWALVYSYEDPREGPSAKGALLHGLEPTLDDARAAATRPAVTVRLEAGSKPRTLPEAERQRLQLPVEPEWARFFTPTVPGPWTKHPGLVGRFHQRNVNDLWVKFLFGAGQAGEHLWVRLDSELAALGAYEGALLGESKARPELGRGARVKVRPTPRGPLWLSEVMAQNLVHWEASCQGCGLDVVFEPLAPDEPADEVETACGACGKTQVVRRKGLEPGAPPSWPLLLAMALGLLGIGLLGWWWLT